jgi:hypothetical protein
MRMMQASSRFLRDLYITSHHGIKEQGAAYLAALSRTIGLVGVLGNFIVSRSWLNIFGKLSTSTCL